jgi:predicted ferric reductase
MAHSHSFKHFPGRPRTVTSDNVFHLAQREHSHSIAPRYASPDPYPLPQPLPEPWQRGGPITDMGLLLNFTNDAEPYTHSLAGVNQPQNWILINSLFYSFMVLLAGSLIFHFAKMVNNYLRHMFTMGRCDDQRYWSYNHSSIWPRIKRDLIYAPLGKQQHNRPIMLNRKREIDMGTVPGRFNTILIGLYIASNVAYQLVLDWDRKDGYSALAELRGRSGGLAAFNLIPTVLFALRNNPLIWLLGISYDTFNLYHRWCARMVIVESVVHTLCWAIGSLAAGGLYQINIELSTSGSYAGGMVGTCAFGFLMIQSWSPIRHAFYETFINGHRLFVILALAGVYIHLDWANLPQYPYLQLCVAFWAIELGWRTVRIVYHNFSRRHGITKVTIEALPSEACRVTFELARPWRWKPGCHVHAYLPAYSLWSSHPFSIAWGENTSQRSMVMADDADLEKMSAHASEVLRNSKPPSMMRHSILARETQSAGTFRQSMYGNMYTRKGSGAVTPAIAEITEKAHKPESTNITLPRDSDVTSISLIMKAKKGLTRKLYDKASKTPTGTLTTWGAIEGPYGGHDSMASYGTTILFAGGVGITHCVGYLHHLILQYQAGTSSTQKILLVWSIQNTEALEWVRTWMDQILRMDGRRDVLRIQLFVTKPRHRGEVISNSGAVQMLPGRCNPVTILKKEMQERVGAVGVTVCGPGAFADSVRSAVREVVTDGNIEFIEEAFSY